MSLREKVESILMDNIYTCEAGRTPSSIADSILSLIDSQRCVWTKDAKITAFRTSCGKAHGLNWNFNYNPMCPGCGHQIEVKDGQG